MDESISARRAWTGDNVGESPEKKARVGGIYVGALYAPTEDIVVGEEDVEMTQYDSDGEENKPMTPEEIAEGDEAEFDKMDKYETYDPVERQPGMRVLDATWVRRRKPDGSIRCRYCVREFKRGDPRTDVFAVASSTSTSRVIDVIGVKMGYGFMTADAENAFWQVPISEEAYMEAPKEWIARQEARGIEIPNNVVWKLKKEWYGRRIAGQKFVEWTAGHLGEVGFGRNPAAPWLFYNSASGVVIEVHMDDIYATGPMKALKDLEMQLHDRIKMKSQIHPMVPGEKFTHLKRTRHILEDGIFLTPRAKYINDLLHMLGLEDCKEGKKLCGASVKLFRAGVGVALYLSYDRTDIQFAVREMSRDMKEPYDGSMAKLHRLARYLQGTKDYGVWLPKEGEIDKLVIHSDTDWANCKKTRKSCACATFNVGNCLLFSYSRSLQMLCLSSGEAEFNGGVAACSEGLFMKEVLAPAGFPVDMEVYLDSSAARGLFQRQGVGRIRHLEVKSLWVQEALQRKLFSLHAVNTQDNLADFGTKGLAVKRFSELREKLGIGNYMTEDRLGTIQEKENGKSVNAVSLQHVSKHALMVAMMALLQGAAGIEIEPNEGSMSSTVSMAGGALADWVFTDLSIAFGIILVIQSLMLWMFFRCLTKHFMVSGGVEPGFEASLHEGAGHPVQPEATSLRGDFLLEGSRCAPYR